jgi:Tfp pilus assembly protein PilE
MVGVLIIIAVLASILYPGFLRPANINDMIAQIAPLWV